MILIKQTDVYNPAHVGKRDILVAGGKIVAIGETLDIPGQFLERTVDGRGLYAVPGFIDAHVHSTGGGGEGGFKTRTPELQVSGAFLAGVTTVVGVLGTDGIARTMENLVAKTYGLREEGLSAFCYSGSYRVPLATLTGDLCKDIMFIEPIIGAGEVALGDHRSSWPDDKALIKIITDARLGGILSGKAGLVNIHLGDDPAGFEQLERVFSGIGVPRTQVLPTHCNRTKSVFAKALSWRKSGGVIDMTATETDDQFSAAEALAACWEEGASLERITMTSDAQGSLPRFDDRGNCVGLGVGTSRSLLLTLRKVCLESGVPLEAALSVLTSAPAALLKLGAKGRLAEGLDADIVLLDAEFKVRTVLAQGEVVVEAGVPLKFGTFENNA